MKIRSSHGIAFALAALVLATHAQEIQYPTILQQPLDQCIPLGASATFSVVATNATSYQWLFNGATMDGQTNSSVTVSNVDLTRIGYYSAFIFNGGDAVPTRSAALEAYTSGTTSSASVSTSPLRSMSAMSMSTLSSGGTSIVVYGLPLANGGGGGSCPGSYSGYVSYLPPSGWGWPIVTGAPSYSATDTNQTNTKIQYGGLYGDIGCNQTTVTIPSPLSPQYRFTTYFPVGGQVPTNAYPLLLTGFQQ